MKYYTIHDNKINETDEVTLFGLTKLADFHDFEFDQISELKIGEKWEGSYIDESDETDSLIGDPYKITVTRIK